MTLSPGSKLLSEITFYRTYAKVLPSGKKETWDQVCDRYEQFMVDTVVPANMRDLLAESMQFVRRKQVVPSMRLLQFAGEPVRREALRAYNCSFLAVTSHQAAAELLYLAACGVGVGYSIQRRHTEQCEPVGTRPNILTYTVEDSRESWADSIPVLLSSPAVVFDYSRIRQKGSPLSTGGTASGPEPLVQCHERIRAVVTKAQGRKLTPFEWHVVLCSIGDAIVSGGVRRTALIALFDRDDVQMLTAKSGNWWEHYPQFARANNSAVLPRGQVSEEEFRALIQACYDSYAGEPGIHWTNDPEYGTNPCQPAWAPLLTPQGIRTLGELKVGDEVWSGKQWTRITKKWSTGVKDVYKVETPAGRFYGTLNHRVFQDGERVEVGEAESIDVCLAPAVEPGKLNPQDVMDGLVIGDGTVHKASNNLVLLCVGAKDRDYHTSEVAGLIKKERPGISDFVWEVDTTVRATELPHTYERQVPDRFYYGSPEKKAGFLRGLFSANGCVTAKRVQLKAASRRLVEQVQDMLSSLGIRSSLVINKAATLTWSNGTYTSKKSYNLIVYNHSQLFMRTIGFLQKYKHEAEVKDTNARSVTSGIRSVEKVSTEEVFDITVEADEHSYWTGGCLVSNCAEIALRSSQTCNLTEVNVAACTTNVEFLTAVYAATVLGTFQAQLDGFSYVNPTWRKNQQEERLLGVSLTGQAQNQYLMSPHLLRVAAENAVQVNKTLSGMLGSEPAARVTTVKPSGTTSTVLGTSAGVHGVHAPHYVRRIGIEVGNPLEVYLRQRAPDFIEDCTYAPQLSLVKLPVSMPGIVRTEESALELLNRARNVYQNWIVPGHVSGPNTHNVSLTVSYKPEEQEQVANWMWNMRNDYSGISLLPFDGGTYKQAPYTTCTEEEYEALVAQLPELDLTEVVYAQGQDDMAQTSGCDSGLCEVKLG